MRRPTLSFDRAPDGSYVLHALSADGVRSLGTYATVIDAWRAVDELDAPTEPLAQAA